MLIPLLCETLIGIMCCMHSEYNGVCCVRSRMAKTVKNSKHTLYDYTLHVYMVRLTNDSNRNDFFLVFPGGQPVYCKLHFPLFGRLRCFCCCVLLFHFFILSLLLFYFCRFATFLLLFSPCFLSVSVCYLYFLFYSFACIFSISCVMCRYNMRYFFVFF